MTAGLYGGGRFCVRRRFIVVAVWFVVTVALVIVSHQLGDNTNDNLSLPGTDSQKATDVLSKSFPAQANGTSPIVLHAPSGKLTDSKYANAVNQAADDVAKAPHVASAVNPLSPQGANALSKGPDDRVHLGGAGREPRPAVQGGRPDDHRRGREAGASGRASGRNGRTAGPEGV